MQSSCIFCRIISGQLPTEIIHQNDHCIVIKDINPRAPIHYLVIPKEHRTNLLDVQQGDAGLMASVLQTAHTIAQTLPEPQAFQFVINNGKEAGQSVFHLHAHMLAGKQVVDL